MGVQGDTNSIFLIFTLLFAFVKASAAYYQGALGGPSQNIQQQPEVVQLYVPEKSVGAVIGSKGQNIKNIMRLSGARIKVNCCMYF